MNQIANTLGYYAYPLTLSRLCTNVNINQWSKWKPISCSNLTLTDNIIKANNCGFKLNGSIPFEFGNGRYRDVLNYAKYSGATWNYQTPTGTTASPYRLGDFRNYNHDAVPFWCSAASAITCQGTECNVGCGIDEDSDIKPDCFDAVNNRETARYYLIYREKGSSNLQEPVSGNTLWKEDEGWCMAEAPLIYSSSIRPKTFECCLVVHEEGVLSKNYLVPNSYQEVTFVPYVPPTPMDYISIACEITDISQNRITFDYYIELEDLRQTITIVKIETGGESQIGDETTFFDYRTTLYQNVVLNENNPSVSGSFTVNGNFHTGYFSGNIHYPEPDTEEYEQYQTYRLVAKVQLSGLPNGLDGTYYMPDYGSGYIRDLETAAESSTSPWWKMEELYG